MGAALDAYRELVCVPNGHAHGEPGLFDCLMAEYAKLRTEGSPKTVA